MYLNFNFKTFLLKYAYFFLNKKFVHAKLGTWLREGEVQKAEMKREIIIEYMRNVFRRIEFWSNYPRANQHEILLSFLNGYDTFICAPIGLTQIHEQTR